MDTYQKSCFSYQIQPNPTDATRSNLTSPCKIKYTKPNIELYMGRLFCPRQKLWKSCKEHQKGSAKIFQTCWKPSF